MSGLVVSGISKRIGDFTIHADFQIGSHERAGLVGRSGSGKTTLLRLIAGLEIPDPVHGVMGRIELDGQTILNQSIEQRQVGYIFQESTLFPGLSILDNVAFGLKMRGYGKRERQSQAMEWLEKFELADRAYDRPLQLSGGERQRIVWARALIWKPKLLLLDEPFSGLDASLRGFFRRELVRLHEAWPVPLLLVTHDSADIESVTPVQIHLQENESRAQRNFLRLDR